MRFPQPPAGSGWFLAEAAPRYTVRPEAWRSWDRYPRIPHLLTEVVEAMEALPERDLEVKRIFRPPAVVHEVKGTVLGHRFRIRGIRDPGGRWLEVWSVIPLDADEGGRITDPMGAP